MKTHQELRASAGFKRSHQQRGFTTAQMIVTIGLITVVSAFALLAIDTARASVRLEGSTRELAGNLEKARSNAIRRNGTSVVRITATNSYTVEMDFDGDGVTETRTVPLSTGVTFPADQIGTSATFDWRGRVTSQIGFVLDNGRNRMGVHVSGSGDVTVGAQIFRDSLIAEVPINTTPSTTVGSGSGVPPTDGNPHASPSPSPAEQASPSPSPSPSASPTTPPDGDPSASPSASPSPGASPSPSAGASPSPSPVASATPPACVLSAPGTLILPKNSSPKSFSVFTITNASNTVLTATKTGDITAVTPGSTTVSGNGTITYTVTYGTGHRSGSVTVSTASCGSKTVTITFD